MLSGFTNSKSPRSILPLRASFVSLDINKKVKNLERNYASTSPASGSSRGTAKSGETSPEGSWLWWLLM